MSAKAPAGNVKRKNGKDATVDIKDKKSGEGFSLYITHVAAQSCAATQVPERMLASVHKTFGLVTCARNWE
jgi:hypothetical protein